MYVWNLTIAAKDKTGAEFAKICAEPQNMIDLDGKSVQCLRQAAASNLNSLGAKDALFIALQRLTDKDTIQYIKKFSNKLDFQTLTRPFYLTGRLHICSCHRHRNFGNNGKH
jgi:hypothetical protein